MLPAPSPALPPSNPLPNAASLRRPPHNANVAISYVQGTQWADKDTCVPSFSLASALHNYFYG
jgi:hypothetical protein